MKRILFVASVNPFKPGGGSQATLSYLDSVIEIFGGENVDVMLPYESDIPKSHQSLLYIKVKIRTRIKSVFQILFGSLSRFTFPLISYVNKNYDRYSLCVINGGVIAGKAIKKINNLDVKTVVIHHNYEVEYHMDNKSLYTLGGRVSFFIKKAERAAFLNSNINLFLTNQDIKMFQSIYGEPHGNSKLIGTYDMKNAGSIKLFNDKKEYTVAISGTLANYQTTVGIEDFYIHYFQIAQRLIPNLKIIITGRSPSDRIIEIQSENSSVITVIPSPNDILSIVQKARIYLCPTNIGGGLKLRAMDGLKCNLPVLVHEVSARGYDYFYGKPYFQIYNNKKSFEEGLSNILFYLDNIEKNDTEIQKDYYDYFSFTSGKQRMKDALILDCEKQIIF